MSLIGWQEEWWNGPRPKDSVMASMAGNAFSGFSFGPVFISAMVCLASSHAAIDDHVEHMQSDDPDPEYEVPDTSVDSQSD